MIVADRADPEMIAACWTSAGDVLPSDSPSSSPFSISDRISAVSRAGFAGMGIAQDDLFQLRDSIGFDVVRSMLDDSPLHYVEIELLQNWWIPRGEPGDSYAVRDVLFEAAEVLGPTHIKIGSTDAPAPDSLDHLVEPLRELCDQAVEHGTRIAVEPMPFSIISTIPKGAELARATAHSSCGLIVDAWHVFRAGTTLAELKASLTVDIVFGIELDDADTDIVGSLLNDTTHYRRYPGEGTFDLAGFVDVVRGIGYTGTWGVEMLSDEARSVGLDEALARAFATGYAVVTD